MTDLEFEKQRIIHQFQAMKMAWLAGVIAIMLMSINNWVSDYAKILRGIEELKAKVTSLEQKLNKAEAEP